MVSTVTCAFALAAMVVAACAFGRGGGPAPPRLPPEIFINYRYSVGTGAATVNRFVTVRRDRALVFGSDTTRWRYYCLGKADFDSLHALGHRFAMGEGRTGHPTDGTSYQLLRVRWRGYTLWRANVLSVSTPTTEPLASLFHQLHELRRHPRSATRTLRAADVVGAKPFCSKR